MDVNLSAIPDDCVAGRILRWPFKFVPRNLAVPILQGSLRGKWWIVGSATHGCWLGSYEYHKRRLFERLVGPSDVVYDVGAHVGFYSLLASVLVGDTGQVLAFEPLPRNVCFLRSHLEINFVTNVKVIEAAISDITGTTLFQEGPNSFMGYISGAGRLEVRMVSLDALVRNGEIPLPDFIKIDVEGGEMLVLAGAKQILEAGPTIFLATHSRDLHRECCEFLKSFGYSLKPITGKSIETTDELLARKVGDQP